MAITKLVSSSVEDLVNPFANELLHVRDEKSASTNGGSSSTGTQTRTLNTVVTNEITGASLSSNQITLPAGTYFIEAYAVAYKTDQNIIKLVNVTDTANTVLGRNNFSSSGDATQTVNLLKQRFTISAQKVFELQHYIASGRSQSNGLGVANGSNTNIYSDVQIWRTA
jgi:hypothetical protein